MFHSGPLSVISELHASRPDPCSSTITFGPPYTLNGVSILGYNITVTSETSGHLISSEFINTTKYVWYPPLLNDTYIIEVAAVNEAGIGNTSAITVNFTDAYSKIKHMYIMHFDISSQIIFTVEASEISILNYLQYGIYWKIELELKVSVKTNCGIIIILNE